MGIKNFVTINTGEIIPFPEQEKINRLNKKIKHLQKKLSKKKKGSNNYKKEKKRIAKAYEKIHNTLKYHFYKISQRLTEKYQVICMETLNIQRNAKKHQTIQQDKPKSMAHAHNNTKTKNTRTRTNTNTNRPMVPLQ